jgi:predicted metal-dependent hydrolase
MFVVIHELAHLTSSSYGHNGEFKDNFKFLLQEAMENGFYNRIDFDKKNEEYCGMQITTTPI